MKPSSSLLRVANRLHFQLSLIVMFFLLASTPQKGCAQGFVGVEPGTSIPLDLKSGVIAEPLPFDVHFYFTGSLDDDVQSMEGWRLGFKTAQACDATIKHYKQQGCPAASWCHNEKAALRGDPGSRTFELLVPALTPNRYYCFEINSLSNISDPAERSRVETATADVVVSEMNQNFWLDPANIQPVAALHKLRTDILSATQAGLGPDEVIAPKPGSFFDISIPVDQFGERIGNQVALFLGSQLNVGPARANLQSGASTASGTLARLSKSNVWAVVKAALQRTAEEPRIAQVLSGREDALGLIGLSGREVVALSEGHVRDLDEIWDAREIDFSSWRKRVVALQDIALALQGDEDLRKAAGLDEASLVREMRAACAILPGDILCQLSPISPMFWQRVLGLANDAVTAFNDDLEARALNLVGVLEKRSRELQQLAADLGALLIRAVSVRASTVASYDTRATWYVGADLGVALAWELGEVFTYAGANIYTRPVNKKAHLLWSDWQKGQRLTEFRKRFSIMFGLPQEQIEIKNAEPLIRKRPLVLGAGFRLNDYLRLTFAGALVFKDKDPNPLVDDKNLAWSPFVGLSIDWNIAGTFQTMFRSVFPGQDSQPAQGEK